MPSLSGFVSFDVQFILKGVPSLRITAKNTLLNSEGDAIIGYFAITQPDGIKRVGNYSLPDVYYNNVVFTIPLRLSSTQEYQKGNYEITYFADHPNYTPAEFTRNFDVEFKAIKQSIVDKLDVFTPNLSVVDVTNYTKSNYSIADITRQWAATTSVGNIPTSTLSSISLIVNGNFYDAKYNVSYLVDILYQHSSNTWLKILQSYSVTLNLSAFTPSSMQILLGYLDNLKAEKDSKACSDSLNALYEKAATLYQHIRSRICAMDVDALSKYFEEYYRLTHNYQSYNYNNTGLIIQPYDFTTGCGGNSSVVKVPIIGIVGAGGVNDPIIDSIVYQNAGLIGIGSKNNGRIAINIDNIILWNFGSNPSFTLDNVLGTIILLNGNTFVENSGIYIDTNQ